MSSWKSLKFSQLASPEECHCCSLSFLTETKTKKGTIYLSYFFSSSLSTHLLNFGSPISVKKLRVCASVKRVERDGLHSLACTKRVCRFSRHATQNSLIKQTLELSSCLQCPSHMDCTELMTNAQTVLS